MAPPRALGGLIGLLLVLLPGPQAPARAEPGAGAGLAERLDAAVRRVEAARDQGTPLGDPGTLFPETEDVTGPGETMRLDHTSLREEWTAVAAEGSARRDSLERLRHRLAAVRAEVTPTGGPPEVGGPPPAGWRGKLADVLSRPEFRKRQLEEDWRVRLWRWLRDKLGFLLPRGTTRTVGGLLRLILYVLAGATLVAVLFVLVRAALPLLARRRRGKQAPAPSAPRSESGETLLALADARTRAGDLRGAAQAVFRWMLLGLHRGGRLEYDPALTNREHLARLRADAGIRAAFEGVSRQFELVWYGFHPVAPEEFAVFRAECQRVARGRA